MVRSFTPNELKPSLKNCSVVLGTPAPAQTVADRSRMGHAAGDGFFTMMLPAPKLFTVEAKPGLDSAVE